MSCHSSTNSLKIPALRLCATSLISLALKTASRTDLFFRLLCQYNRGKREAGDRPLIQLETQNDAFLPSPIVTLVAAVKRAMSVSSTRSFIPAHGLCVLLQASQSQRNRRALLNFSMSRMLRPPKLTGLATYGHPTLHFPPVISPSPAHRKRLRNLSSSSSNCFGALMDVSMYIGIALRTERTSSLLPVGFNKRPCQLANLFLALSTIPCR